MTPGGVTGLSSGRPPGVTGFSPIRRQAHSLVKRHLFGGRERPVTSRRKIPQPDRPIGEARQPIDLESHRLTPAANDSVAAFFQSEIENASSLLAGTHSHLVCHQRTSIEDGLLPDRRCDLSGWPAVYQRRVSARNSVTWMGETVHRLTIGGKQQETGGHDVQAANIRQSGRVGDEVHDRAPTFLVFRCGHDAERLVEGQPAALLDVHRFPDNGYALPLRVYLHPEGSWLPVYFDLTLFDQLLCGATRSDSRTGKRPLEPHLGHDSASTYAAASSDPSEVATWGRNAIVSSSVFGRSERSLRPSSSRNSGVVPYRRGRPRASLRPTTSIRPRSCSERSTPPAETPRISSISTRPTGCRYAITARVSSVAALSLGARTENCARSSAAACTGRVRI